MKRKKICLKLKDRKITIGAPFCVGDFVYLRNTYRMPRTCDGIVSRNYKGEDEIEINTTYRNIFSSGIRKWETVSSSEKAITSRSISDTGRRKSEMVLYKVTNVDLAAYRIGYSDNVKFSWVYQVESVTAMSENISFSKPGVVLSLIPENVVYGVNMKRKLAKVKIHGDLNFKD